MSRSYEYSYELERARRQAIYNERVSETTERFYRQYVEQYEKMLSSGYRAYIPDEMNQLSTDLSEIRSLLVTNPTEARDLSFVVGSYIRSMYSMAKTAVEQFDRAERMRVEQIKAQVREKQGELLQKYFELLRGITNPIIINFAQDSLEAIKSEIQSGSSITIQNLENRINEIVLSAAKKAEEWKETTVAKQKIDVVSKKLEEAEQQLLKEKIEDSKKTKEFLAAIDELKNSITTGSVTIDNIEKEIQEIECRVDDELVTEDVRRETVKSIMKQLKLQEFEVGKPQIVGEGTESYVKIVAQKPSGKRAACKIDLQGKISYKFDNYEGMTCLKDIEQFNIDLEQIYSIKLSDERVLWSNPDKLSKDAESVPKNDGRYV